MILLCVQDMNSQIPNTILLCVQDMNLQIPNTILLCVQDMYLQIPNMILLCVQDMNSQIPNIILLCVRDIIHEDLTWSFTCVCVCVCLYRRSTGCARRALNQSPTNTCCRWMDVRGTPTAYAAACASWLWTDSLPASSRTTAFTARRTMLSE